MIHDATCHIVIAPPQMGVLEPPIPSDAEMKEVFPLGWRLPLKAEPPIPSDEEIEEVFPDWRQKQKIFVGRCLEEEGRDWNTLTPQDLFRFGMKFIICEAKKLT